MTSNSDIRYNQPVRAHLLTDPRSHRVWIVDSLYKQLRIFASVPTNKLGASRNHGQEHLFHRRDRYGVAGEQLLTIGYIGSSALNAILKADSDAKVTVYGRRPEVVEGFSKVDSRLVPAIGSLDDHDKLEKLASEHDITVNCADADGKAANQAILRGLKKRHESGKTPILIHTSGTGTLSDLDAGTFATKDIYTDLQKSSEFKTLASLPDDAFHRDVDLDIVRADQEGYVKAYIILPSTIYGISETPFADAGLCNPQSQQVPLLIRISLDRKAPAMVGEGKNLWPDVHIQDQAVSSIPCRGPGPTTPISTSNTHH